MGSLSPMHWMLVLLVVVLLFGTGRISSVMGDFAKGLKSFKKNMAEDDASMEATERPAGSIAAPNVPPASPAYTAPVTPQAAYAPPPAAAAAPVQPPVHPAPVDHA